MRGGGVLASFLGFGVKLLGGQGCTKGWPNQHMAGVVSSTYAGR